MILLIVISTVLGTAIFCRPHLSTYAVSSTERKEFEAFTNSCKAISKVIVRCESIEQLHQLHNRIRTIERLKNIPYPQHQYHLGEIWVHYFTKQHSLTYPEQYEVKEV